MRTDLTKKLPTDFEKCPVYEAAFGPRPLTHAIACSRRIEFGGSSRECSTSSATDLSAMAYALLMASSLVSPYANAPGTSEISAIQRPSVSRSVSMVNCKSWLPRTSRRFVLSYHSLKDAPDRNGLHPYEHNGNWATAYRKPSKLQANDSCRY